MGPTKVCLWVCALSILSANAGKIPRDETVHHSTKESKDDQNHVASDTQVTDNWGTRGSTHKQDSEKQDQSITDKVSGSDGTLKKSAKRGSSKDSEDYDSFDDSADGKTKSKYSSSKGDSKQYAAKKSEFVRKDGSVVKSEAAGDQSDSTSSKSSTVTTVDNPDHSPRHKKVRILTKKSKYDESHGGSKTLDSDDRGTRGSTHKQDSEKQDQSITDEVSGSDGTLKKYAKRGSSKNSEDYDSFDDSADGKTKSKYSSSKGDSKQYAAKKSEYVRKDGSVVKSEAAGDQSDSTSSKSSTVTTVDNPDHSPRHMRVRILNNQSKFDESHGGSKTLVSDDRGTRGSTHKQDSEKQDQSITDKVSGSDGTLKKYAKRGSSKNSEDYDSFDDSADGKTKSKYSSSKGDSKQYAAKKSEYVRKDGSVVKSEAAGDQSDSTSSKSSTVTTVDNPDHSPRHKKVRILTKKSKYDESHGGSKTLVSDDRGTRGSTHKQDSEKQDQSITDKISGPDGTLKKTAKRGSSKNSEDYDSFDDSADGKTKKKYSSSKDDSKQYAAKKSEYVGSDGSVVQTEEAEDQSDSNSSSTSTVTTVDTPDHSSYRHQLLDVAFPGTFEPGEWTITEIKSMDNGKPYITMKMVPKSSISTRTSKHSSSTHSSKLVKKSSTTGTQPALDVVWVSPAAVAPSAPVLRPDTTDPVRPVQSGDGVGSQTTVIDEGDSGDTGSPGASAVRSRNPWSTRTGGTGASTFNLVTKGPYVIDDYHSRKPSDGGKSQLLVIDGGKSKGKGDEPAPFEADEAELSEESDEVPEGVIADPAPAVVSDKEPGSEDAVDEAAPENPVKESDETHPVDKTGKEPVYDISDSLSVEKPMRVKGDKPAPVEADEAKQSEETDDKTAPSDESPNVTDKSYSKKPSDGGTSEEPVIAGGSTGMYESNVDSVSVEEPMRVKGDKPAPVEADEAKQSEETDDERAPSDAGPNVTDKSHSKNPSDGGTLEELVIDGGVTDMSGLTVVSASSHSDPQRTITGGTAINTHNFVTKGPSVINKSQSGKPSDGGTLEVLVIDGGVTDKSKSTVISTTSHSNPQGTSTGGTGVNTENLVTKDPSVVYVSKSRRPDSVAVENTVRVKGDKPAPVEGDEAKLSEESDEVPEGVIADAAPAVVSDNEPGSEDAVDEAAPENPVKESDETRPVDKTGKDPVYDISDSVSVEKPVRVKGDKPAPVVVDEAKQSEETDDERAPSDAGPNVTDKSHSKKPSDGGTLEELVIDGGVTDMSGLTVVSASSHSDPQRTSTGGTAINTHNFVTKGPSVINKSQSGKPSDGGTLEVLVIDGGVTDKSKSTVISTTSHSNPQGTSTGGTGVNTENLVTKDPSVVYVSKSRRPDSVAVENTVRVKGDKPAPVEGDEAKLSEESDEVPEGVIADAAPAVVSDNEPGSEDAVDEAAPENPVKESDETRPVDKTGKDPVYDISDSVSVEKPVRVKGDKPAPVEADEAKLSEESDEVPEGVIADAAPAVVSDKEPGSEDAVDEAAPENPVKESDETHPVNKTGKDPVYDISDSVSVEEPVRVKGDKPAPVEADEAKLSEEIDEVPEGVIADPAPAVVSDKEPGSEDAVDEAAPENPVKESDETRPVDKTGKDPVKDNSDSVPVEEPVRVKGDKPAPVEGDEAKLSEESDEVPEGVIADAAPAVVSDNEPGSEDVVDEAAPENPVKESDETRPADKTGKDPVYDISDSVSVEEPMRVKGDKPAPVVVDEAKQSEETDDERAPSDAGPNVTDKSHSKKPSDGGTLEELVIDGGVTDMSGLTVVSASSHSDPQRISTGGTAINTHNFVTKGPSVINKSQSGKPSDGGTLEVLVIDGGVTDKSRSTVISTTSHSNPQGTSTGGTAVNTENLVTKDPSVVYVYKSRRPDSVAVDNTVRVKGDKPAPVEADEAKLSEESDEVPEGVIADATPAVVSDKEPGSEDAVDEAAPENPVKESEETRPVDKTGKDPVYDISDSVSVEKPVRVKGDKPAPVEADEAKLSEESDEVPEGVIADAAPAVVSDKEPGSEDAVDEAAPENPVKESDETHPVNKTGKDPVYDISDSVSVEEPVRVKGDKPAPVEADEAKLSEEIDEVPEGVIADPAPAVVSDKEPGSEDAVDEAAPENPVKESDETRPLDKTGKVPVYDISDSVSVEEPVRVKGDKPAPVKADEAKQSEETVEVPEVVIADPAPAVVSDKEPGSEDTVDEAAPENPVKESDETRPVDKTGKDPVKDNSDSVPVEEPVRVKGDKPAPVEADEAKQSEETDEVPEVVIADPAPAVVSDKEPGSEDTVDEAAPENPVKESDETRPVDKTGKDPVYDISDSVSVEEPVRVKGDEPAPVEADEAKLSEESDEVPEEVIADAAPAVVSDKEPGSEDAVDEAAPENPVKESDETLPVDKTGKDPVYDISDSGTARSLRPIRPCRCSTTGCRHTKHRRPRISIIIPRKCCKNTVCFCADHVKFFPKYIRKLIRT